MRPGRALKRLERGLPTGPTGPRPRQPTLGAGLVGLAVVDEIVLGSWGAFDKVTAVAEDLLSSDNPEIVELVTFGLIEGLHNAASHEPDDLSDQIRARLSPQCETAWIDIRCRLDDVHSWMEATSQTLQPAQLLDRIESNDLKRLARINYWRTPDGGIIGVADVADHQKDIADRAERGFS